MALESLPEPDIQLSRSWWLGYRLQRSIGSVLSYIPNAPLWLARLERLIWYVRRATTSEYAYRQNKTKAAGAGSTAGYGYKTEAEELAAAEMYRAQALTGQYPAAETPALMAEAETVMTDFLARSGAKRMVNFGVSYASIDSKLATKFPAIKFIGIDRSQAVCELNRKDFALPNLEFAAADMMNWIDAQADLSDCVFFHMRIVILMPQTFVDSLYAKLAAKNCLAVCGFEPVGVSRETNDFPVQSFDQKPSVFFRDTLYIHNYAGLLTKNGFVLEYLNYVKTAHIDHDVRMLSFVATHQARP